MSQDIDRRIGFQKKGASALIGLKLFNVIIVCDFHAIYLWISEKNSGELPR